MTATINQSNSLTTSDLPNIHGKILFHIMTKNESGALKLINLIIINKLETAFQEEQKKNLNFWPCTLLESAESMKMMKIINLLKDINKIS